MNENNINKDATKTNDIKNLVEMKKKLKIGYNFIQFSGFIYVLMASVMLIIAVLSGQFLSIIFFFGTIILSIQYLIKLPKKLKLLIGRETVEVEEFNGENKYFINAMYISTVLIAARIIYMASYDSEGIGLGILIWFFIFYLHFGQRTLSLPKKILEKHPQL